MGFAISKDSPRQSFRLGAGAVAVDEHPCPHPVFQTIDVGQALFEDINWGAAARPNVIRGGVQSLHKKSECRGQRSGSVWSLTTRESVIQVPE